MQNLAMLVDAVRAYIREHALLPEGTRVLAGLSGGVDSVVLVHLLRRLDYDVRAAHVNYGLRGDASAGDEGFARRFCNSFDPPVPLRVAARDAEARAERQGASLQEAARRQRYAFFRAVAEREGIERVAVGHHRRDQAETLLLNLLRGSGPEGLAGMRPERVLGKGEREKGEGENVGAIPRGRPPEAEDRRKAVRLVRPLLAVGRGAIEAYAREHGLRWRTDRSNRDPRFKRAALRHDVLPAMEAHFPGGAERLARTADLLRACTDEVLRPALEERFAACAEAGEDGGRLDVEALREAPPFWQGRLLLEGLRRWLPAAPQSRAVADELRALLDAQVGRRVDFASGSVWRERGRLRFARGHAEAAGAHLLAPGRPVRLPGGGVLRAQCLDGPPADLHAGAPHAAFLDADRLRFPLTVRPWRDGDRLHPLGMDGTKPVSDLLTDAKVPPSERRRVWVLLSEGEIVWVAGHRLAEHAKVRPSTRRVVRVWEVESLGS